MAKAAVHLRPRRHKRPRHVAARVEPGDPRVFQPVRVCRADADRTKVDRLGGRGEAASDEGAARAVGRANAKNPVSVVIPCHRVVGSDGSLTGYGGGMERKRALLELEGVRA